jgi:uncharacterized integral membrane protein (TIGR00698 family)
MKWKNIVSNLYGLALVALIGVIAYLTNEQIKELIPLEAVTLAIIFGIAISNTIKLPAVVKPGIKYSASQILQYGIILLGFKLNFTSVANLGLPLLIMILIFTPSVIALAVFLGKRIKIDGKISLLIGIGSGICGASAIVAMSPVVKAKEEDSIVAVTIVNFLGAIGVLVYSFLASQHLLTTTQYGIWSGISLQGVAHALAAAFAGGDSAGEIGTIVKMGRVLMLVPIALFFSVRNRESDGVKTRVRFPLYVLFFVISGIINSLHILPVEITHLLAKASNWFILFAMTGMGLSVQFKSIRNSGIKGLLHGVILFAIVSLVTLGIITLMF